MARTARQEGVGGEECRAVRAKIVARRPRVSAEPSRKIPFPFRRKNGRAQNQNCKENFSARQAAALRRLAAGFRKSGIFDKVSSSRVIKTLHIENPIAILDENGLVESYSPSDFVQSRSAVRVIIFDQEGKIALNHYTEKEEWSEEYLMPGGGVDVGEDLLSAIQREALEECGVNVSVGKNIGTVIQLFRSKSLIQTNECFLARVLGEKGVLLLTERDKEHRLEIPWLTIDDAIEKCRRLVLANPKAPSPKHKQDLRVMRQLALFLLEHRKDRSIQK